MKLPALLLLVSLFSGCAAHVIRLNPYQTVPTSMVQVASINAELTGTMMCSGWVVDSFKGIAVTAGHCIIGPEELLVVDGKKSKLLKKDKWVALVQVEPGVRPQLFLRTDKPEAGEVTVGSGWAWGKVYMAMQRVVSGFEDDDIIVNGPYIEGMSGGPVVDSSGRVVGIIEGGNPAISVLTSSKYIKNFMDSKEQ